MGVSEKDEQEHSTKAGGTEHQKVLRHKVQLLSAGSPGHTDRGKGGSTMQDEHSL